MWQAQGGLADPFKGNAAHRRLARMHGATLLERSPVTAIRDAGGGDLEVGTAGRTYRTGRVVLAADAWTNQLLAAFDRHLPLTVTKEQVTYFACPDPAVFAPRSVPGLDLDGRSVLLRLPDLRRGGSEGGAGLSAATRSIRTRRTFERDEAAFARVEAFMGAHLPGAVGPPIYTKTCLYTLTPDRDFVVDRLPGRTRAWPSRSARRTASSTHRSWGASSPS